MSTLRTLQTTVLRKILLSADRDQVHDLVDITATCSMPSGRGAVTTIRNALMPTLAEVIIELFAHGETVYAEVWRSWIPGPEAGQRVEWHPDEYTMPAEVTAAINEFFAGLPHTAESGHSSLVGH